jgi:hypothetical protein
MNVHPVMPSTGRDELFDVGADGGNQRVGALAAGAVCRAEVELGRDAIRAGHADLRTAVRPCPEELILSGVVPDRLDLVERLDHLVDREHVPADRAELARRGLERQAGHLPCDALDPAAPAVLPVGEDVQARRLLIVDGQLAVVVEQLLAVGGAEAAFPLGVREDVEPAGPRPAASGRDRQCRRVLVVSHGCGLPGPSVR